MAPGQLGICINCAEAIPWIVEARCRYCGRGIGCPDCIRPEAAGRSFVCNRSAVYYSAEMREWLALYKYRGHERYAALFIAMMNNAYDRMDWEMSSNIAGRRLPPKSIYRNSYWQPDAVTFVPVSQERLSERGFNQAEVLATGIALHKHMPSLPLLIRGENTAKQSFKSRQQRIDSMKHIFEMHPQAELMIHSILRRKQAQKLHANKSQTELVRLLLVDDIYTTGSTIDACASVLHQSFSQMGRIPLEVYSLTWARS
ncbi:comF operon protein ComFC [Paenibacillus pini]